MSSLNAFPAEGGCDCQALRYRMDGAGPLVKFVRVGTLGSETLNAQIDNRAAPLTEPGRYRLIVQEVR
jgi:hypothetical protein